MKKEIVIDCLCYKPIVDKCPHGHMPVDGNIRNLLIHLFEDHGEHLDPNKKTLKILESYLGYDRHNEGRPYRYTKESTRLLRTVLTYYKREFRKDFDLNDAKKTMCTETWIIYKSKARESRH